MIRTPKKEFLASKYDISPAIYIEPEITPLKVTIQFRPSQIHWLIYNYPNTLGKNKLPSSALRN